MQNYPPNNPQDQNQQPVQNYDASYIQQQLNQQLIMQQGVKLNVLDIMTESAKRLGKHFGNVFLGWLVYFITFTLFWIVIGYLMQLFLLAILPSVAMSIAASGFTFATVVKLFMVAIGIVIVLISASMIFYFGFLSYISDLIELGSPNFSNIFTGFQKIFQIIGFVSMIVIPMIVLSIIVAVPFGFLNEASLTLTAANSQASNPFTIVSVIIYSLIMLVAFLLYVSKLILVPNLLIAQDMTLKEAVKESWNKVQGNTFLHVFLLLILMGIVSYLINLISVKYVAPAIITGTKWSFIWYSVVNSLMVQVVFVYFIGCIAHTYNSLYPLEIKTDPFAKASKYSRKTHPKYFQPLNKEQPNATEQQYYAVTQQTGHLGLQQQQNTPDQEVAGFNAPNSDPFLSPNEKPETPAQPKIPKPYKPQNVQENTQPAKTNAQNNEGSKKDDGPASKQKIQYISQKPEKPAVQNTPEPQSDKYIPVSENELVPQQEKPADQKTQKSQPEKYITVSENELVPQQEKAHVTKFVDNLFEKEDYPVGKIVPVDAMRMMRDSDVKFIEVQFQNAKHAMNTMKMLPIFINVPDSTEYKIREPLSYSLTLPKIPSNPVKLFFGGKDMTIKELWTCKEIILQNKGNIVRINRGKDE